MPELPDEINPLRRPSPFRRSGLDPEYRGAGKRKCWSCLMKQTRLDGRHPYVVPDLIRNPGERGRANAEVA